MKEVKKTEQSGSTDGRTIKEEKTNYIKTRKSSKEEEELANKILSMYVFERAEN